MSQTHLLRRAAEIMNTVAKDPDDNAGADAEDEEESDEDAAAATADEEEEEGCFAFWEDPFLPEEEEEDPSCEFGPCSC